MIDPNAASSTESTLLIYMSGGGVAAPPAPKDPQRFGELDAKDQLAAYVGLRVYESDYDRAQGTLRVVASTWILAIVGALGFLVLQAQTSIVVPNPPGTAILRPTLAPEIATLLRQAVLMLGGFGILGLWYLDQRVYQRLLHAIFAYGCHMEAALRTLPGVRMFMYRRAGDVTARMSRFYTMPTKLMLLAGALNLAYAMPTAVADIQASLVRCRADPLACAHDPSWMGNALIYVVHLVATVVVLRSAKRWSDLADLLPDIMKPATIEAARADALDRLKP